MNTDNVGEPDERGHPLGTRVTETANPATRDIDIHAAQEIVGLILTEDARVAEAVAREQAAIARLAEIVAERLERGGRLVYAGAGTSGRLGALDAAELPPTFGTDPQQVIALIAGGPQALTRSVEAAEDSADAGRQAIAGAGVGPGDVVLGIAASGRTPFVLGAVHEARTRGAFTAGLSSVLHSELAAAVDLAITPVVGPEVIAGSTRMKAGTAQKLVLNALSTTVMILLGKTYRNLMVDMRPTNEKLRRRAITIVAAATGLTEGEAASVLAEADGEPKTAIVMVLTGAGSTEARRRLEGAKGRVRAAIQERS